MPYVLKPNKLFVKDPEGTGFLPQNAISDRTTAEDIALWREAVAGITEDGNEAIAAAQTAMNGIEAQKDTMIALIASVAGLGTDTTLTQSGVAADSKATGDAVGDLKSALNVVTNYSSNDIFEISANDLSVGGINTSGSDVTAQNRLRSSVYIPICDGMKITFIAGTKCNQISIREYNIAGVVSYYSSWTSDAYSKVFDHNGYVRFMVRNSDNLNLSVSDYDAIIKIEASIQSFNILSNLRCLLGTERIIVGALPLYWQQGGLYVASGLPYGSQRAIASDFVSVIGLENIKILNPSGKTYKIYEYDNNKTFVTVQSTASDTNAVVTFDVETKYIRVQLSDVESITTDYAIGFSAVVDENYINEKIEDVKTKIEENIEIKESQFETFTGVNVLSWEQGGLYAASGLPYDTPNAIRTGYISVDGIRKVAFCNPKGKTWKVYPYDTSNNFISGEVKAATSDRTGDYTIGSSTKYIRIQLTGTGIVPSDAEGFMLADTDGYIFDYIENTLAERQEVSILFVGNSLTQDGIAYLPYLLKTYYPEIRFRFYMWYNGGKTLKQQYEDYFYPDNACSIFSVAENTTAWTNYSSTVKMSEICTTYQFDIVCLQEYFNYKTEYTVANGINDWNNCRDYITSHYTGGNELEFISLFHAPLRNNAPTIPSGETTDTIFQKILAGNKLILQKTIADDMIPNGIGIYRALSTSLDDLGDMDHLSPDGTHTQEGLPCLLQTFVTACWLFDRLGVARSVYGCPLRMTTAIYDTLNVPGANLGIGVIEGTDAQNLLAQEVAIKAYKEGKQFVMQSIWAAN